MASPKRKTSGGGQTRYDPPEGMPSKIKSEGKRHTSDSPYTYRLCQSFMLILSFFN
jgi:hypothetical protein